MKLHLLFPCDYFNKNSVDSEYESEYAMAKLIGFNCYLFDFDTFVLEGKLIISPDPYNTKIEGNDLNCILYRGWMLKLNRYKILSDILENKYNFLMINSPQSYEYCHHFDNVYPNISEYTPSILVVDDINTFDISKISETFYENFMIKDNVKSVKNENFPEKISVNIDRLEFERLANEFIKKRGDLYNGQIILKQFVNLKKYNKITNEYRVFYFLNKILTVSRNSNQTESFSVIPQSIIENKDLKNLISLFYTIDFAETEDKQWIVIEAGDGQVSGLPPNQNIMEFYTKINNIFNGVYNKNK